MLANAVKQVERLNYLDINGPDVTKKIFLNRNEIIKLPENCFFVPLAVRKLEIEKKKINTELEYLELKNQLDLTVRLKAAHQSGNNSHNSSFNSAIELKIPIFDGGLRHAKETNFLASLNLVTKKRRVEETQFSREFSARLATEKIFSDSILSINEEIQRLYQTGEQLEAREELGQGVFEEKTNNVSENSKLTTGSTQTCCRLLFRLDSLLRASRKCNLR